VTRATPWLRRRRENGPAASEPRPRSECLLHGLDPVGTNRIQGCGAIHRAPWRAPLGSDENNIWSKHDEALTEQLPYKGVALADTGLQLLLELANGLAEVGLERAERIPAEQALGSIVQQFPHRFAGRQNLVPLPNLEDERAHAERPRAAHATPRLRPIG